VAAGYSRGANTWFIGFDKPLQAGTSSPANYQGVRQTTGPAFDVFVGIGLAMVAGNQVTGGAIIAIPATGPSRISYAATPADLIGTNGLPVVSFVDFPLIVGP